MYKILVLFLAFLFLANAITYSVSVHVSLKESSLGNTPNCEGITVSKKSKSLFATRYYNGSLIEVTTPLKEHQIFASNIVGQMTGIKIGDKGEKYVCLHSANPLYNGVWRIEDGAVGCNSIDGVGCVKIFPRNNENILFPDGLAIARKGNTYAVFVSDPPSGNIWVFKDNGKDTKGKLFAGTDALSVPNYLQGLGVIFPLGSDFNPIGRGFGANGLSYDSVNEKLYVAVAETALVVSIKVKTIDGEIIAGTQSIV